MIDGMQLDDVKHGRAGGPVLVLLPGFTQTGEFWANQLAGCGADYRLLIEKQARRPSRLGEGGSAASG